MFCAYWPTDELTHSWTVLSTYQSVGIYKRKREVKKERNTLLTKKASKKKETTITAKK